MRPAHAPNDGGAFEASADGAIRSGPEPSFELMLASGPAAPAAARAAMRAWMGRAPTDALLIDALMVIGELVANSVRHAHAPAGSSIGVHAEMHAGVLRLEVLDAGTSGVVTRRRPNLANGGGFGLNVVATLSRRWGVAREEGTRVWAELAPAPAA